MEGEGVVDYSGQPWRELYAESAVEIASLVRANWFAHPYLLLDSLSGSATHSHPTPTHATAAVSTAGAARSVAPHARTPT
eukprot:COSAG01_NODE_1989_length_8706_cov_7.443476_2_plen_80_part_00